MRTNKATKILFIVFVSLFASILIAGVCMLSIFGFNKSAEIEGGEKITIVATNAGIISDNDYKTEFVGKEGKIISAAKKVLNKHGKINIETTIIGEGNDKTIVLIYKDADLHRDDIAVENALIVSEIKNEISLVSSLDLSVSDAKKVSASTYINWGVESIAICALILLIFTYFMFRFNTKSAVCVLIGMVLFGFVTLALFAVCRIEITKFLACLMAIGISEIAISWIFVQNKVKKLFLTSSADGLDKTKIIPTAIKSNLFLILGIGLFVFVFGAVFAFINLTFGIYLIVASVLSTLITLFVMPGFQVFFEGKQGVKLKFNNLNK